MAELELRAGKMVLYSPAHSGEWREGKLIRPSPNQEEWLVQNRWFWTEQYLLQAFLAFNSAFHVLLAGSLLRLKHSHELKAAFTSYDRASVWPTSFWIRRNLPTP